MKKRIKIPLQILAAISLTGGVLFAASFAMPRRNADYAVVKMTATSDTAYSGDTNAPDEQNAGEDDGDQAPNGAMHISDDEVKAAESAANEEGGTVMIGFSGTDTLPEGVDPVLAEANITAYLNSEGSVCATVTIYGRPERVIPEPGEEVFYFVAGDGVGSLYEARTASDIFTVTYLGNARDGGSEKNEGYMTYRELAEELGL